MKKQETIEQEGIPFLLLLAGSFGVIFLHYAYTFIFMEQYQLFQDSAIYWNALVAQPSGLSEYIGARLSLFMQNKLMVCLLVTGLLLLTTVLFRLFLWRINRRSSMWLAIFPALLCLAAPPESLTPFLCILFSLLAAILYTYIKKQSIRWLVGLLLLPLLYAFAAPAQLLFAALCISYEWTATKSHRLSLLISGSLLLISALIPLLAMRLWLVMPLREAFLSQHLAHPEQPFPVLLLLYGLSFPLLAVLFAFVLVRIPGLSNRYANWGLSFFYLLAFGGLLFVRTNPMERIYQYDYWVRRQNWQALLADAQAHGVPSPQALVYVNLALANTNQMGDQLFAFPQAHVEGLIPQDPRTRLELIQASEVAWHLGHIQAAQRFAFVGVLSAQRCVQSRLMRRLIETYLVQEEYRAAEKYIKQLEASPIHRTWATRMRAFLDPAVADATPWIQQKRLLQPQTDNPFDLTQSFPNAVAYLIDDHSGATPAFSYGISYLLLDKNLTAFAFYMEQQRSGLTTLPKHYQEALCYYYLVANPDQAMLQSYPVDKAIVDRFQRFMQLAGRVPLASLQEEFGDASYYYFYTQQPRN